MKNALTLTNCYLSQHNSSSRSYISASVHDIYTAWFSVCIISHREAGQKKPYDKFNFIHWNFDKLMAMDSKLFKIIQMVMEIDDKQFAL